jgi:hypothetical protein
MYNCCEKIQFSHFRFTSSGKGAGGQKRLPIRISQSIPNYFKTFLAIPLKSFCNVT